MQKHRTSPQARGRGLRATTAVGVAAALVISGVGGLSLSASAAPFTDWEGPWLAGAPVLPGDGAVDLGDGTQVDADYNIWAANDWKTFVGELQDIQSTADPRILYATGKESGWALTSQDGGETWQLIDPTQATLTGTRSLSASSDGQTIAVGTSTGLSLSKDGSASWTSPAGIPSGYAWDSVAVSDDGATLVAIGGATDGSDAAVWVSSDAGSSWAQTVEPIGVTASDAVTSSDGGLIAVLTTKGAAGSIEWSADHGATWASRTSPTGSPFDEIAMSGNGQKVVVTKGVTYEMTYTGMRPVHAADESTFSSQDAGSTWAEVLDPLTGASVGYYGVAVPSSGVVPNDVGLTTDFLSGEGASPYVAGQWFAAGGDIELSADGSKTWESSPTGWITLTRMVRVQETSPVADSPKTAPVLDAMTPSDGPTSGGDRVELIGDGFDSCSVAEIAGIERATTFLDTTRLAFTTPAGAEGSVRVRVVSTCGFPDSNSLNYIYVAPSVVIPPITDPPLTEPPVTEPPVTDPPVTDPPVTEPPVTDPPVTEPPTTEPPTTEPPTTEPPTAEPPTAELPTGTPAPTPELNTPVVTAFEAHTGVEDAPDTRGLSVLAILAGLAGLGVALIRRRKKNRI